MFKREAKQFCLNTALHGYRFIILPKRILLERFFWTVVCLIALATALTLLFIAYVSFHERPTVTVTDTNHYPIWHYSFPAVTICNYNTISKSRSVHLARKLASKHSLKKKEVVEQLRLLFYLYEYNLHQDIPLANLTDLQDILDKSNISIKAVLKRLSSSCDEILKRCLWKGEEKRCDSIFETIITTNGYCCSFNYYALKNHTFRGPLAYKVPHEPRRVSACGYQTGLEVLVDNKPEDYFASLIPSLGHKVLIHNPYEFPDWNFQNNLIHIKTVNFLGLNPTITYCSNDVKNIPIEKRECLFPYERNLIYFQEYNFHNCMVECRMNLTIELCQCVPVLLVPDDNDYHPVRFCNLKDVECLIRTADLTKSSIPGYNLSNFEQADHVYGTEKGVCKCLPDCQTTSYLAESSYGILAREFCMNHLTLYSGIELKNHSVIRVFFNDLVGIKNRTDVRFNWHTLLAFYGGLLGLFMGFSFISGIEIIYFFTIRPLTTSCSINKAGSDTVSKMSDKKISAQQFY